MSGRVVTFYSYKGGVGRSFALANVAVILAQWGARVLAVDWDIEAPGLNHYFAPMVSGMDTGVLDFVLDCSRGAPRSWQQYTTGISLPETPGQLRFMPVAGAGVDFATLVQGLSWDELYREHDLGRQLEELRHAWVDNFDMILVDSRTGITDFSGLTTAQLPDILAFMFTANQQSLIGCANVVRRAMAARTRMSLDRPALLPLPIPARIDLLQEYELAQQWRERFRLELASFLDIWTPTNFDHLKLIDHLTIPYVARWTFGEDISALVEPVGASGTRTLSQVVSYVCETLAALLIQGFAKVELLVSSRDEYVHSARSLVQNLRSPTMSIPKVFFSYAIDDFRDRSSMEQIVSVLGKMIGDQGRIQQIFVDNRAVQVGADWSGEIQSEIEQADAFVVCIGPSFLRSAWQQRETEWWLRQGLRTEQAKPTIPVVLPGGEEAFKRSRFADHLAVFIDPKIDLEEQLRPVVSRLGRSSSFPIGPRRDESGGMT
jgi:hypothetical protein